MMATSARSGPVAPTVGQTGTPASPSSPTSPAEFHDAKQSLGSPQISVASPETSSHGPTTPPLRQDLSPPVENDVTAHGHDASNTATPDPNLHPRPYDPSRNISVAENTSVAPAKIHPTLAEDTALEPKSSTSHGEDSQDASSPANIMLEATAKEVEDTSYPTSHGAHLDDPEKIESLPAHLQPASSEASAADEGEKPKRPSLARRQTTRDDSRPPSLHYTLRTRKLYITIFWALILIDSIAIPLVLYFCLHYLTSLSANSVFSISTACLGGISIIEYILRFWRLWRHNSKCRVIGGKRWYLDWFHFNFSAAWIFIMVELIVGTSPDDPPIRLLAMPLSSLCFFFCLSLITQDILRVLKVPQPCRISSLPRGSPFRPGIYHIVEDICAVDGSGGTIFRRRLNARWNASHDFRQMIHRLTLVWSFCMLAVAIATTVLIFTLTNGEIAYIIGWTVPFVGAGFLTLWTFWYVKRCLKHEYANWAQRRGQA